MATTDSYLSEQSPESTQSPSRLTSTSSRSPRAHRRSPSQNVADPQIQRQHRHSKKLSINFPILLPTKIADTPGSLHTASPTACSTYPMTHGSFFSPPSIPASHAAASSSMASRMPLTPPSEEELAQRSVGARGSAQEHVGLESTSTDFLTLLASQERRVLELKEELARAETELTTLKRQWAMYESGKKKSEVRQTSTHTAAVRSHTRAASVVELGTGLGLSGIEAPLSEEKLEAERERRRELARERMMGRMSTPEIAQTANGTGKKTNQRVFQGSRHTRTLSLLTATTTTRNERTDSLESLSSSKSSLDSAHQSSVSTPATTTTMTTPSLSRTNSALDGLSLGKTYKDLASAASRKNLPQGLSPEQFVKHGKQVVDGMRDGLWNFIEDIRQATVGEEAITGASGGVRRQNSTKDHAAGGDGKLKRTMTDAGSRSSAQQSNETSFWKEFGVDTPKSDKSKRSSVERRMRPSLPGRWPSTKTGDEFVHACPKHHHHEEAVQNVTSTVGPKKERAEYHESKSSTDSRNPPSLVGDLLDDEDDNWDNWDSTTDPGSPQSERKRPAKQAAKKDTANAKEGARREVQWHDLMS